MNNGKIIFSTVILIAILVMAGFFYFFVKSIINLPQNTGNTGKIVIEKEPGSEDFEIEDNGDENGYYNIKYLDSDGKLQEAYHISKSIVSDPLSRFLHSTAKEGRSPLTSCFTLEKNGGSRLVDITFDTSGSINSLSMGFANFENRVMSRIKEILKNEELRPGDHIRVRFLGANNRVVEENKFDFDFTGPNFECSLLYQRAHDLGIITIKNVSFATSTYDNLTIPSQVFEKIKETYYKTIGIKGAIGDKTPLVEHLNTIVSDNQGEQKLKHFGSVVYILQTDGKYSDENVPLFNPLNVSPGGKDDKVYFIGLDKRGRVTDLRVEDKMKELFKPISYIKFFDSVSY